MDDEVVVASLDRGGGGGEDGRQEEAAAVGLAAAADTAASGAPVCMAGAGETSVGCGWRKRWQDGADNGPDKHKAGFKK